MFDNSIKSIAFRDALARIIAKNVKKFAKGDRGTGKSGVFAINHGSQKILNRNSIVIKNGYLEARLLVGLPAFGRRIAGFHAEEMFFKELPKIIEQSLFYKNIETNYLYSFVHLIEKQEFIRAKLDSLKAFCFITNNSMLPRSSGIEDTPLQNAIPFKSPESQQTTIEFPDGSKITGMIVKKGITLITGGGFHGKSTLLNAIQSGIYNHIPDDGREFVISIRDLVKIRAEDGRGIQGVDISPFINNLPNKKSTTFFSTQNASGSTSQATNIIEALEVGAKVLLMDEDTSATNFLIRDKRMQKLIPSEKEPITPFIDVAKELYQQCDVSTIIITGGSGDYIDIADTVILMDQYTPIDITTKAREIADQYPFTHIREFNKTINIPSRIVLGHSMDPIKSGDRIKISSYNTGIQFGRAQIELMWWEHIVDKNQYDTIGDILYYAMKKGYINDTNSIPWILQKIEEDINKKGLDSIHEEISFTWNYYCEVRKIDMAAALNRLRSLRIKGL